MKYWIAISLTTIILARSAIAAEPAKTKPGPANVQPLTYANVVSFFKSAHFRATEVQKRCIVFFEGEWTNANIYNYCLIIAENSDEDIQITFYLTDAHEMNWVTEFLDSPFFTSSEKQALFGFLNRAHGARSQKIGRFQVEVNNWRPRHAQIIVLSFTRLRQT